MNPKAKRRKKRKEREREETPPCPQTSFSRFPPLFALTLSHILSLPPLYTIAADMSSDDEQYEDDIGFEEAAEP